MLWRFFITKDDDGDDDGDDDYDGDGVDDSGDINNLKHRQDSN